MDFVLKIKSSKTTDYGVINTTETTHWISRGDRSPQMVGRGLNIRPNLPKNCMKFEENLARPKFVYVDPPLRIVPIERFKIDIIYFKSVFCHVQLTWISEVLVVTNKSYFFQTDSSFGHLFTDL